MVENLKEKLNNLPNSPGVYVMLGEDGEVIYVGKAVVLKNRVRQYFHSPKNLTDKVIAMVNKINDFYYYVTKTETDALILESNLIKKYQPQYNILLKDDKNYPFIKINRKKLFPKIEITRKLKKDGCAYFGPYMGGVSVKDLSKLISDAFLLRTCNLNFEKIPKSHRPCLNYHMGKCYAPCVQNIEREDYDQIISKVVAFLKGDTEEIYSSIKERMQDYASEELFERALEMRDTLKIIDKIKEKKLSALPKNVDMDIYSYSEDGINRVVNRLIIRQGRMQGGQNYNVLNHSDEMEQSLTQFVMQVYEGEEIPDEIILSISDEGAQALKDALSQLTEKRFNVISPKMGMRKALIDMSTENASDFLEKSIDKDKIKMDMTEGANELLRGILGLEKLKRIECFDISNISGVDKVASMTVAVSGEVTPKHYRRFKIRTVEGANDFASMQEVIERRLTRLKEGDGDGSFGQKPDLIVVDGGLGQIKYAKMAMEKTCVTIPLISLAEKEELIYFSETNRPLRLPKSNNALKLLIRIRDEAHRFAVTYFRTLHKKNSLLSSLDSIEGLGEKRKNTLIEHFKKISSIKTATVEELKKVKGLPENVAKNIFDYFHKEETNK